MSGRQVHRSATAALSMLMVVIGVALLVEGATAGGSAFSARVVIGALFLIAGIGRLYVESKRGPQT